MLYGRVSAKWASSEIAKTRPRGIIRDQRRSDDVAAFCRYSPAMSPQDQYLQTQLPSILQPGESVVHTAYMRRQPGLLMQLLLVGGLLLFLMTKAYFAVLTNRRLILIRSKMSFWTGGPKPMNLGVESIDLRSIQKVTVDGFANNRSMTFHLEGGKKETLRISPWFKQIAGTKAFFEEVPKLAASGQLAQMAHGAGPAQLPSPPMQQAFGNVPPMHAVPAQAPMAHAGYGPPPQAQAPSAYGAPPQPQGFGPGARVVVHAPDGNRYPATIVDAQNGSCLCTMPNGQNHWFPANAIVPA